MILNKEKIFFIIFSFAIITGITIYSVSSDRPDTKPVISTYISDRSVETITVESKTEKSEMIIKYPIDINFATKEELCSLEGIGNVLSEKIIEYRKEHYFYSVEDITKVSGIGEKFIEENKDKIFVDISRLPEITEIYHTTTTITKTTQKTIVFIDDTSDETEESTVVTTIIITTECNNTPKPKRVNLNTATYEDLLSLSISPETAEQILDLREKTGYFSSTDELCYIENFSYELYMELFEYIYVE